MYYFIVNPNAHGGRGEKIWRKLERQIIRSGIRYEAYQTEEPGDARRIAAALTADMQEPATIVAVGGDGTVNEVLNGLAISERLTFGYIPTGYGNDLARGLKLSGKPGKCLKRILRRSAGWITVSFLMRTRNRFTAALWSAVVLGLTLQSATVFWIRTEEEVCDRSPEKDAMSWRDSNSL